jgi:adenylate cyclase
LSEEHLAHRLVAILAADVAGYSRLMAGDARATVRALDAARRVFRTKIEEANGRVIDMAGDAVLAVFDTAIGAVTAALAVQRELAASIDDTPEERRMRFRIGIHLGDVIQKADGTVYGDGVNIAARLESLAEPGGIATSESIRIAVKGKVDATFADEGEQRVKNIPDPVRVYRLRWDGSPSVDKPHDPPLPDSPSIAVLPFTNMSGDPEQEYFADGMTEDILTALARISGLLVIARNSTFVYKKQAVDVQEVGRKFGVRHVLEGSVRKAGSRVRITAQLIETATGGHVWADRFDRSLEDIFAVQDEVTNQIVQQLEVKLTASERDGRGPRRKVDMEAYELLMQARSNYWRFTPAASVEARAQLHRAIALDPDFAQAHALLAQAHATVHINSWEPTVPHLERSEESAKKALALDPDEASGHRALALLMLLKRNYDDAESESRIAVRLAPSDASGHLGVGAVLEFTGRYDEAIPNYEIARRLDPNMAMLIHFIGRAHFGAGRFAEAEDYLRQRLLREPHSDMSRAYLASICGADGRVEEARRLWSEILEINPRFSVRFLRDMLPYKDVSWFERFLNGLYAAELVPRLDARPS